MKGNFSAPFIVRGRESKVLDFEKSFRVLYANWPDVSGFTCTKNFFNALIIMSRVLIM